MTNVRAAGVRRAESVACPRCLSSKVLESRRNPLEGMIFHTAGLLPCRCATCMLRFAAFVGPYWLRAFFGKLPRRSASMPQ